MSQGCALRTWAKQPAPPRHAAAGLQHMRIESSRLASSPIFQPTSRVMLALDDGRIATTQRSHDLRTFRHPGSSCADTRASGARDGLSSCSSAISSIRRRLSDGRARPVRDVRRADRSSGGASTAVSRPAALASFYAGPAASCTATLRRDRSPDAFCSSAGVARVSRSMGGRTRPTCLDGREPRALLVTLLHLRAPADDACRHPSDFLAPALVAACSTGLHVLPRAGSDLSALPVRKEHVDVECSLRDQTACERPRTQRALGATACDLFALWLRSRLSDAPGQTPALCYRSGPLRPHRPPPDTSMTDLERSDFDFLPAAARPARRLREALAGLSLAEFVGSCEMHASARLAMSNKRRRLLARLPCARRALLRSEDAAVGDLVARRPQSASHRRARRRLVRRRRRHLPCRRNVQGSADTGALPMDGDHDRVATLGAGVLARRRQDLGDELDDAFCSRRLTGRVARASNSGRRRARRTAGMSVAPRDHASQGDVAPQSVGSRDVSAAHHRPRRLGRR